MTRKKKRKKKSHTHDEQINSLLHKHSGPPTKVNYSPHTERKRKPKRRREKETEAKGKGRMTYTSRYHGQTEEVMRGGHWTLTPAAAAGRRD